MKYFSSVSALAIAAVLFGGLVSPVFTPVAHANNGLTVSAVPNSGTLTPGQSLEIRVFDSSGTTDAVSDSCLVNNVNVNSTFHNAGPGDYRYTYTVGASDANRAAGTIPIDCTLHQAVSIHITAFDDSNTVAIDTTGSTGGGSGGGTSGGTGTTTSTTTPPTVPSFSSASLSPYSGTLVQGNTATVTFTESHNLTNLTLTGECLVNAKDVSSSWHSTGGGQYVATYTVQAGDGERPAGHIPLRCQMGNSAGNALVTGWTDGNTTSIDTNGDGTIDNGTSTLGFTVSANPSSGTLHVGDHLIVSMQDPLPSADVVIGSTGCRVNDVDVAGSYHYEGNGLYTVNYTVGASDANRPAGQIPFDCKLQNQTGSVHLVAFTDNNTTAIDTTAAGGGTGSGGTTGGGTTTGTTTGGTINGDVTGGGTSSGITDNGMLHVDSIEQVRSTATAGGGYGDGWVWIFHVTVPSNEASLQMKFDNWTHSNGTNHIDAAHNMRFSSNQAASTSPITITSAGTYSGSLTLTGDLDAGRAGRQIEIRVEMQVPASTLNGSYSTTYGVRSI